MNTIRAYLRGRGALALLLLIPAALLVLGGCESDATAPQDPTPQLSERDAASQAGLIAMAIVDVGPEIITFSESGKTVYNRSFFGEVSGTVFLDFRLGGPSGPSATWATGTWARLYTGVGEPLVIQPEGIDGSAQLGLDVTGDLNRGAGTAVLNGGGTFSSGTYTAAFTFDDLAVATSGYPDGGTMTFTGGGFVMTVAFNGTSTATVTVQGHGTWTVNLETGAVTPAG
ncbi:MAG: hypothetical protein IPK64_00100 [bacterium]|nr:hypothetical protein [bacterium]